MRIYSLTRIARITTLLVTGLSAAACRHPGPNEANLPLPPSVTGRATQHSEDSIRLRDVMRDLVNLEIERLPQELQAPERRQADFRETVELATALADASGRIATLVDQVGLDANQRRTFLDLANQLRDEAVTLNQNAQFNDLDAIQTSMQRIDRTCAACHGLFRPIAVATPSGDSR